MISTLLFSFLFLLVISAALYFLFVIFLPSLDEQKVNVTSPFFSRFETGDAGQPETDFNKLGEKKAVIVNREKSGVVVDRSEYNGPLDCALFYDAYASKIQFPQKCCALGNCVRSCSKKAIYIRKDFVEISSFCDGCGDCVRSCPGNFIELFSVKNKGKAKNENFSSGLLYKICRKVYTKEH